MRDCCVGCEKINREGNPADRTRGGRERDRETEEQRDGGQEGHGDVVRSLPILAVERALGGSGSERRGKEGGRARQKVPLYKKPRIQLANNNPGWPIPRTHTHNINHLL